MYSLQTFLCKALVLNLMFYSWENVLVIHLKYLQKRENHEACVREPIMIFFLKVNLSHGKPCFIIFNHKAPITQFSYDLNAQLF